MKRLNAYLKQPKRGISFHTKSNEFERQRNKRIVGKYLDHKKLNVSLGKFCRELFSNEVRNVIVWLCFFMVQVLNIYKP